MAFKHIFADHLTMEEVDYELTIRGKKDETKNDAEAKYRMLRYMFKEDEKENRVYESPYTIDQEYDIVSSRVQELRKKLANNKLDKKLYSRLNHYWCRIHRIMPSDAESERMRKELINDIRTELAKFEKREETEKKSDQFSWALVRDSNQMIKKGADEVTQVDQQNVKQPWNADSTAKGSSTSEVAQKQPSERERALEAMVAELQRKLEAFENCTEGAKGGNIRGDFDRRENAEGCRGDRKTGFEYTETEGQLERSSNQERKTRVQDPRLDGRERYGATRSDGYNIEDNERHTAYRFNDRHRYRNNNRETENRDTDREPEPRRSDPYRNGDAYRQTGFRGSMESDRRDSSANEQYGRQLRRGWNGDMRGRVWRQGPETQERARMNNLGYRYEGNDEDWCRERGQWQEDRGRRDLEVEPRYPPEISSDEFSEDERYFSSRTRPRQFNYRRISEVEIRDADRRMEKWHLSFSGEARSRSLEDFLLKVRRLAKMDRIADDVLMQRVHTILRGEAYDWYLCYADEFHDWSHFEERIRYMYGNPNKDQGNRQKIYERKQNRNETFLSFKMEIERLNKLLSSPLDQQRIFEVIWDNMRPHYRSKLACKTVRTLQKLEYYAYRIDANDPVFRNVREGPSRANAIHNIEVEQKEDESYSSESESENVNAITSRYDKDRKPRDLRQSGRNHMGSVRDTPSSTRAPLCWNCRKNGHLWRNCPEEKRLFCYLCGTQGKTVTTCENHLGDARVHAKDDSGN